MAEASLARSMSPDMDLVQQVREGDVAAYSELVSRHRNYLMKLALRITKDTEMAEDIVQDSLIKAYTKIHNFRGQSSFKSWLYRITLNTTKNQLRSKKRESVGIDNMSLSTQSKAENLIFHQTLKDIIQSEVDQLPEKQRQALSLRIFQDLSFKEIASIMECPYDTAKANYRHALMKLKAKVVKDKKYDGWREIRKAVATQNQLFK